MSRAERPLRAVPHSLRPEPDPDYPPCSVCAAISGVGCYPTDEACEGQPYLSKAERQARAAERAAAAADPYPSAAGSRQNLVRGGSDAPASSTA